MLQTIEPILSIPKQFPLTGYGLNSKLTKKIFLLRVFWCFFTRSGTITLWRHFVATAARDITVVRAMHRYDSDVTSSYRYYGTV